MIRQNDQAFVRDPLYWGGGEEHPWQMILIHLPILWEQDSDDLLRWRGREHSGRRCRVHGYAGMLTCPWPSWPWWCGNCLLQSRTWLHSIHSHQSVNDTTTYMKDYCQKLLWDDICVIYAQEEETRLCFWSKNLLWRQIERFSLLFIHINLLLWVTN